ncbi:MAG: DNA cytosine methyltransferase [Myxococcota bacterium]
METGSLVNSGSGTGRYRLIDLFAGAGGMTLGFTDNRFCGGFHCVLSVDNDRAAVATHKANFHRQYNTESMHVCANVEDWLGQENAIPPADVVIGGPPCQGFSLLNKKRVGDERRALWRPFLAVVRRSGACLFVIENVAELSRSPEFLAIQRAAGDFGFDLTAAIVNAADYGVPQTRRRTVIVGWNRAVFPAGVDFPPARSHSPSGQNDGLPHWLCVRDAIGDLPDPAGTEIREEEPPLDLHFGRRPTPVSMQRYRAVPPSGNRFDLQRNAPHITPACWVRKVSGGTDLFGRLWWDRPSVTIRTEFFKPEKGRYLHPEKHRPITHREAARLMGFPDDFVFRGSKIEIARQIGNAVPPPLAGAIAAVTRKALDNRFKPFVRTTDRDFWPTPPAATDVPRAGATSR